MSSGEEEFYEVEKITDKKVENSKTFYLVKWVGYLNPTWEPQEYLTNCNRIIEEFECRKKGSDVINGLKGELDTDSPEKIINATIISVENKELNLLISWKIRPGGIKPFPSWISSKIIRMNHPHLLLDFYEARLVNVPNYNNII